MKGRKKPKCHNGITSDDDDDDDATATAGSFSRLALILSRASFADFLNVVLLGGFGLLSPRGSWEEREGGGEKEKKFPLSSRDKRFLFARRFDDRRAFLIFRASPAT